MGGQDRADVPRERADTAMGTNWCRVVAGDVYKPQERDKIMQKASEIAAIIKESGFFGTPEQNKMIARAFQSADDPACKKTETLVNAINDRLQGISLERYFCTDPSECRLSIKFSRNNDETKSKNGIKGKIQLVLDHWLGSSPIDNIDLE